jgi:hypothetical protein
VLIFAFFAFICYNVFTLLLTTHMKALTGTDRLELLRINRQLQDHLLDKVVKGDEQAERKLYSLRLREDHILLG